jgi:hypothetical protein
MKNIRVSDQIHAKLTGVIGQLIAESGKIKTYEDAGEALLSRSVILPSELVGEIETFVQENHQQRYTTKEEFLKDAARFRIEYLTRNQK